MRQILNLNYDEKWNGMWSGGGAACVLGSAGCQPAGGEAAKPQKQAGSLLYDASRFDTTLRYHDASRFGFTVTDVETDDETKAGIPASTR